MNLVGQGKMRLTRDPHLPLWSRVQFSVRADVKKKLKLTDHPRQSAHDSADLLLLGASI